MRIYMQIICINILFYPRKKKVFGFFLFIYTLYHKYHLNTISTWEWKFISLINLLWIRIFFFDILKEKQQKPLWGNKRITTKSKQLKTNLYIKAIYDIYFVPFPNNWSTKICFYWPIQQSIMALCPLLIKCLILTVC